MSWQCDECGSLKIEVKAWQRMNDSRVVRNVMRKNDDMFADDFNCPDCDYPMVQGVWVNVHRDKTANWTQHSAKSTNLEKA